MEKKISDLNLKIRLISDYEHYQKQKCYADDALKKSYESQIRYIRRLFMIIFDEQIDKYIDCDEINGNCIAKERIKEILLRMLITYESYPNIVNPFNTDKDFLTQQKIQTDAKIEAIKEIAEALEVDLS